MSKLKQVLFVFFGSIILGIIFSKFLGIVVYKLIKPITGMGPQLQCPECLDGFILSYLFFISIFFQLATFKSKNKFWLLFLIPIVIYINPPFEFLIVGVALVLIGWLAGWLISLLIKKFKKS